MRILMRIVIYAAAVWVAVVLIDGLEFEGEPVAYLGVAVILAVVNAVVKPVVKLLSLPFIFLTLGLFLLLINTAMLWIVIQLSDAFGFGLTTSGFGTTFLGAIAISIVVWAGERLLPRDR